MNIILFDIYIYMCVYMCVYIYIYIYNAEFQVRDIFVNQSGLRDTRSIPFAPATLIVWRRRTPLLFSRVDWKLIFSIFTFPQTHGLTISSFVIVYIITLCCLYLWFYLFHCVFYLYPKLYYIYLQIICFLLWIISKKSAISIFIIIARDWWSAVS